MSAITTHVLDTSAGRPAAGVPIVLEFEEQSAWRLISHGATDEDGRLRTLLPVDAPLTPGAYRLVFSVDGYYAARGTQAFFRRVTVEFVVAAASGDYHVPLLISPFGYTTYRGT
jgi:5-hydroxyisourate hydrolase